MKHKIRRKPPPVSVYSLLQNFCFNLIKLCQLKIEHYPMAAYLEDFILDELQFHVGKIVI